MTSQIKYNWVFVDDRLPDKDPERPGKSVIVFVKFHYMERRSKMYAYYDFIKKRWNGAGYNRPIKNEVLAWTNDKRRNRR